MPQRKPWSRRFVPKTRPTPFDIEAVRRIHKKVPCAGCDEMTDPDESPGRTVNDEPVCAACCDKAVMP